MAADNATAENLAVVIREPLFEKVPRGTCLGYHILKCASTKTKRLDD
jgi:hypothetical protein